MLRRTLVSLSALLTLLVLGFPAGASAAGAPDVSLAVSGTGALYGQDVPVRLTATSPTGAPYGYNLAFRVVLPAGASYAGGAAVAPRVIADQPTPGATTLLFDNVADISPNSSQELGFSIAYDRDVFDAGDPLPVAAGVYVNTDPRTLPDFDASGQPAGGTFTGSATATQDQPLRALEVTKDEPSPEGEILRGLHDHQTVYTVTVRNNEVNPTAAAWLDDYVPAGLEFLGCGGADHTTDAAARPRSTPARGRSAARRSAAAPCPSPWTR
jgi:hypothetical protein